MFTQARLAFYLTVALGGGAVLLRQLGLAEYDAATSTIDLLPINLKAVALFVAGPAASALAALAVVFKWGQK